MVIHSFTILKVLKYIQHWSVMEIKDFNLNIVVLEEDIKQLPEVYYFMIWV